MNIVLARIDDRLIHGQVVTVWSKVTNCQRIIVCDDDVANDTIRATLLKQVAPAGIKSHVVTLDKAIASTTTRSTKMTAACCSLRTRRACSISSSTASTSRASTSAA